MTDTEYDILNAKILSLEAIKYVSTSISEGTICSAIQAVNSRYTEFRNHITANPTYEILSCSHNSVLRIIILCFISTPFTQYSLLLASIHLLGRKASQNPSVFNPLHLYECVRAGLYYPTVPVQYNLYSRRNAYILQLS